MQEGVIAAYGVSVETVDEALTAIARPNVASVQIIFNAFRLKPLDEVLPAAKEAGVGIIARVPLASGLLSGRYTTSTTFAPDDHRTYNRSGEAFDVGETFSGVDFETGVARRGVLGRGARGRDAPRRRRSRGSSRRTASRPRSPAPATSTSRAPTPRPPTWRCPTASTRRCTTSTTGNLREAIHPRW